MIKTRAFALLATAVILCGTCQFGTSDQGHRTERTPDFKQLRAELNFELTQPCVMAVGTGHFLEIPVKIQSEDVSIKWVNWKKSGPNIDLWLVLESAGKNETKDHRAIVGIQDVNRTCKPLCPES